MPKNMKYDAVSSQAGAAKEEMGAYKRKGAAESKYLSEDGDVIDQNKKTAGPGKGKMHMDKKVQGPGEFGGKKGDDSKSKKDYEGPGEYAGKKGDDSKSKKDYEGPGRSMGYTQNFGPARVNSYAKGAAKVNSIMGRGAAQLDADAFSKFAIQTGDDQTKSMLADERRANLMESAGQFKDSLNLVKKGQGAIAKDMYGDKLQFGNVAGTNLNSEGLSASGVKPGSLGAKNFGVDESENQRRAGQSLLAAFRQSQPD